MLLSQYNKKTLSVVGKHLTSIVCYPTSMNLSQFTDLEFFDLKVGQGFSGGSVV